MLLAPTAQAHHPIEAKFDVNASNTLQGQVSAVDWSNPHVHVFINVSDADGSLTNWALELPSRIELEWSGWLPDTLSVGERVEVTGWQALNGTHQLWVENLAGADGSAVYTVPDDIFEKRLAGRDNADTPRWPDGLPRLGPPPGATGYWTLPGRSSLVEDGRDVPMESHGLLNNLDDAAKVAPFQPWALDLYRLRQSRKLRDDPSFLYCVPPGGPRQFQLPYGVQFVEEKAHRRLFVLLSGGNGNWRQIYTDDRSNVGQVSGNDDNPLFYGRARAHWEGDTLIVETTGFNEGFWFSNGGLPHTRHLQLTERFTRTDLDTLHYSVTVNDPGAYTRAWTSSWDLQWLPGEELPEYYCQDNRP
ncbi:MAG TPA: DUF6152 family protein [Hyphomicrobiales bacterium]|nr:DUF6152 family protein [Hyphomicrobiales bacterium]